VSGLGGTHWGRIEGDRAEKGSSQALAAKTFQNWGIGTTESLLNGVKALKGGPKRKKAMELWASGGVRSGLDAAKLIALGAKAVGFAQPAMAKALLGRNSLIEWMAQVEYELKTAMFCTGSKDIKSLSKVNWKISNS
jgi:isopentenyl-diphosphate delta-isomerase